MRTKKLTSCIAVALLSAAPVLVAPTVASADPATPHHGIAWFQKEHGLRQTGNVNTQTAKALQKASASDLRKTFETPGDLDPDQMNNARTVIGVGKGANIPDQGQVIALMTAMQESKFVNYTTPVDHDSLGIFQQRPSMGWGTPDQITNVVLSSKSFYGVAPFGSNPGLIQISGWQTMAPGDACQAVQKSADPGAYAQWEGFARDLLAQQGPTVDPIP